MNRFDKLSLLFPNSCIDMGSLDMTQFKEVRKQGNLLYLKYEQKQPYLLSIRIEFIQQRTTVVEFTGKILKDHYPSLINEGTITECLEEINKSGICILNIPQVLQQAEVMKCDVTLDVERREDFAQTVACLKASIRNRNKWINKKYQNGIVIENTVACKRYKKRMVVYQKEKELELAGNKAFLNMLSNPQSLLAYFKDKMRIEINLMTKTQIRNMLQIQDTSLKSVLASSANPILNLIDEALEFVDTPAPRHSALRDMERTAVLKLCGWDVDVVEAKIRNLLSKNTRIKRTMKPYKRLAEQHEPYKDLHTESFRDLVIQASSSDGSAQSFNNNGIHPIVNIGNQPQLPFLS